ncbi:MAG: MBL fold metallo-hydrolase [Parcubacteria group bacterium]|nr:MBL fold metallo-hydrolase [Parcubacteria group bacterium]
MKNIKIKILLGAVVLLGFANFFVWVEVFGLGGGELEVVFFDVGQGDSIFIETPEGHQVLVDAGPSGGIILEKLAGEMPFWDRTIDWIVLTHPDYDHLRGFLDVLDRYEVKNILWTGVSKETKTFERWMEKIEQEKSQGANVFIAKRGQVIKTGDALFYVFHPFENLEGVSGEKGSNGTSIVMKLVFGENSFLFLGDIGKKEEASLLVRSDSAVSLSAQVLKVAHHGSKSSRDEGFFEVIAPEIAVISVGRDNSYGHPSLEVLQDLEKFGINILRTDEKGDIKITASGSGLFIK